MLKKQLLILLIICWSQHSSGSIPDLFSIGQQGLKFISLLNEFERSNGTKDDFMRIFSGAGQNRRIIQQLENIDSKLDDLRVFTRNRLNHITELLNTLPDEIELRSTKREIAGFIISTNDKWVSLVNFAKNQASKDAYSSLATQIINTIGENLSKFRNDFTPFISITPSDSGFFMLLAKHAQDKRDELCDKGETSHHTLTRLYELVILTDIKAYILLSFAYTMTMSKADGQPLLETVERKFREQFLNYTQEYIKSLKNGATPYLRACDVNVWRSDEDYQMLAGLLQQTIYDEPHCWSNTPYTCQQLADGKNDRRSCDLVAINEHSKCNGQLYDCQRVYSPLSQIDLCVWSEGPYKIRYFTYYKNKLGTDTVNECPAENLQLATVGFHEARRFCSCQCRSREWKILLDVMTSREKENYVIVGMRINKFQDYLYIQIAEGELQSNGYISNATWVPATRLWLPDKEPKWEYLNPTAPIAFFFDDLQLLPGYLLTGVAFATTGSDIQGFTIRVVGRKVNYETGLFRLHHSNDIWKSDHKAERELKCSGKNSINMKPYETSRPDSQGYTHIWLRQSDLSDDYGQSTLPLFDSVPIMTNPLSPIGGVGLFHKSYDGYAGFLSLRLYPISYSHFMDTFLQTHNLTSVSTWDT